MFRLYFKKNESGILVSGISTVGEDTNGCSNQYMCALAVYLITVLSSSCGIIMYCKINASGYGKKF